VDWWQSSAWLSCLRAGPAFHGALDTTHTSANSSVPCMGHKVCSAGHTHTCTFLSSSRGICTLSNP
jgi:hypothetical protein